MTRPLAWMVVTTLLAVCSGCGNWQHPRNDPFLGSQITPPPATGAAGEITPSRQYYEQGRGDAKQSPAGFGIRGEQRSALDKEKSSETGTAGLNFRKPSSRYGRQISTREEGDVAPTTRKKSTSTPAWNKEEDAPSAGAPPSGGTSLPLRSTNPGDNPLKQTAPPSSRYGGEADREDADWNNSQSRSDAAEDDENPRYLPATVQSTLPSHDYTAAWEEAADGEQDPGLATRAVSFRNDRPQ